MFEKIFRAFKAITLFVLLILSIIILSVVYLFLPNVKFFPLAFLATAIVDILVYISVLRISYYLAKGIVSPISDISDNDAVYEELKPLVSTISQQSNEIKRQSDKAKTQKLQLKSVMSNMNDGLIILDEESNVLSINKCAQNIFGVKDIDIKYKPFMSVCKVSEFDTRITDAMNGKNSYFTFLVDEKAYQAFLSPVVENDMVCGVVIFLVDVSEKHKTEQIRREFSANVSHELKTPLTTIFGYSQIITNGIAKPDDINGFAQKIEKESARLISLIDDIISLSNLEEKGADAQKETVSLSEITQDVIESLTQKAKARNITFELLQSQTTILASRRQIYELIFNLCDNAVKYNKENGNVKIKILENGFAVSDTGIGIPQDSLDRIFERFYRVDKSHSKKVDGTGLGLSIVKHIIQSNNAEISVESQVGIGTKFTVLFK